jgi:hypothetical protein
VKSLASGLAALVFAAPALAMRQCPAEFGEKHPLVNFTGWVVLGLGLAAGAALMYWSVSRAQGRSWGFQLLAWLAGAVGMVGIGCLGLLFAVNWFFFAC